MSLSNFVKRVRNIMRNDAGINGDAQRIEQMAWMLFLKVYDEKENDWELDDDDYKSIIPEECRWRNWAHDDGSGNALTGDELLSFVNNTLFVKLKNIEVTPDTPIRQAIVKTTFEDANQYMKDGVQLRQVLNVIDGLNLGDYEESHAFGEIYETILKEMQSAGSSGEFYTPRALTEFMAEIVNPQIGEKWQTSLVVQEVSSQVGWVNWTKGKDCRRPQRVQSVCIWHRKETIPVYAMCDKPVAAWY